jgi:hypothetical protein
MNATPTDDDNRMEQTVEMWNQTSAAGSVAHGTASLIDGIITFILASVLGHFAFRSKYEGFFIIIFYLFKDVFFGGASIGKRFSWCFVFDVKSGDLCPWWKQPIRILITFIIAPIEEVARMFLKVIPGLFTLSFDLIREGLSLQWGAHLMGLAYINKDEFLSIEEVKGKMKPKGSAYKYGWVGLIVLILILKAMS